MSDLIDRAQAIDELVKMLSDCFYADEEVIDAVETTLKELPSAQPEPSQVARDIARIVENEQDMRILPKRGKWVLVCDNNGMHFICNKCGAWRYHQEQNFCGECGADMRGGQDG